MNDNNDLTNFRMDNSEHEVTDTKELLILSLITVSEGACKTEFYFERCRIKNDMLILDVKLTFLL